MTKKQKIEKIKNKAYLDGFRDGQKESERLWKEKLKESERASGNQMSLLEKVYNDKAQRFKRKQKRLTEQSLFWAQETDNLMQVMGVAKGVMSEYGENISLIMRRAGELKAFENKFTEVVRAVYAHIEKVENKEPSLTER